MAGLLKKVTDLFFKSQTASNFDIFESKIDGEFHGWSGRTPFALANGQIWQQASNGTAHHHAYAPKVVIYRSGSEIKMSVEGTHHSICVKRIR